MKKVLLGTSAIALAGAFATQASAAEWTVKVGGYLEEQVVFTDTDDSTGGADFNGVDVISDGEIHFSPSITLDNGLKFGARIELEGATSGDQIDENYLYVEGSFGRLSLGEDDNAAYIMAYGAPDVSFYNINSGSDTDSLPFAAAFGTTSTYPSVEGDSAGIRYFTPRLAGFQLGASYARDANRHTSDSNKDTDADGALHDIWAVAANYANSFGDVSVAASAGYTRGSRNGTAGVDAIDPTGQFSFTNTIGKVATSSNDVETAFCNSVGGIALGGEGGPDIGDDDAVIQAPVCAAPAIPGTGNSDPTAYAFGLNIGFGGVTVGGSYANYDETGSDRYVYDIGASYETGPWGFSATYLHSKQDDSDAKIDKFLLAVSYAVASGVKVGAFGAYEELDVKGGSDIDGFVIGTGVKLNF
ncbi:MAG TPA: porin [Thermohalobaculum sp.]|nr:porin [Thermohalobaculum sp.]